MDHRQMTAVIVKLNDQVKRLAQSSWRLHVLDSREMHHRTYGQAHPPPGLDEGASFLTLLLIPPRVLQHWRGLVKILRTTDVCRSLLMCLVCAIIAFITAGIPAHHRSCRSINRNTGHGCLHLGQDVCALHRDTTASTTGADVLAPLRPCSTGTLRRDPTAIWSTACWLAGCPFYPCSSRCSWNCIILLLCQL